VAGGVPAAQRGEDGTVKLPPDTHVVAVLSPRDSRQAEEESALYFEAGWTFLESLDSKCVTDEASGVTFLRKLGIMAQ
jgi:hypothetical protein